VARPCATIEGVDTTDETDTNVPLEISTGLPDMSDTVMASPIAVIGPPMMDADPLSTSTEVIEPDATRVLVPDITATAAARAVPTSTGVPVISETVVAVPCTVWIPVPDRIDTLTALPKAVTMLENIELTDTIEPDAT
jgi:hypothetical protein